MNSVNKFVLLAYTIALSSLLGSCTESKSQIRAQALQELDIKIEVLKKKKAQECREQAFMEAELHVDSLISAMFLSPIDDSLYSPPIPAKPAFIEVDTNVFNSESSVKPVIEN